MARFWIHDLKALESAPGNLGTMRSKLGDVLANSSACKARVEAANPETGEYRIVLQGTLAKEERTFE